MIWLRCLAAEVAVDVATFFHCALDVDRSVDRGLVALENRVPMPVWPGHWVIASLAQVEISWRKKAMVEMILHAERSG
jgi:hypothetical protein